LPSALPGEYSGALKMLSFEVIIAIMIPVMTMQLPRITCSA